MKLPSCNLFHGLHLDREGRRGVATREDLLRRKQEIEALLKREDMKEGIFNTVEEEMEEKYPIGRRLNPRKTHETSKANGGKAPTYSVDDK